MVIEEEGPSEHGRKGEFVFVDDIAVLCHLIKTDR